jgi:hypothetical protein
VPFLLFIAALLFAALTPGQRSTRARIAALARWANEDPTANAERGQAGLRQKFYDQTDPSLPEAERQRRADCAYREHMARIAFQRSRRAQAGGGDNAA